MTRPRLDVVSLFAGVGGIDRAAEQAGMTTRLVCEVDQPCRNVLAARFPTAVIHPDVRTLTADDLHRSGAVPRRTVLTAGWPCQGNSVAGTRGGMADPRSGLWSEVARVLGEFRPAWFVGENVPGLLSVNAGRDFAAVIHDLALLGYGFGWRVLDARHFGVPQRRRRVVLVGHLGDSGAASAEILFEPEGVRGDSAARRETGPGTAARARAGAAVSGWTVGIAPTLESGDNRTGGVRPPGTTVDTAESLVVGVLGEHAHALTAEGADASEDGTGRGTPIILASIQDGRDMDKSQNGLGVGAGDVPAFTLDTTGAQAVAYAAHHVNALDTAQGGPDDNTAQGGQLVAYPMAVRGRDGSAELEIGEPGDPMFALRAGNGGSSRSQLIATETPDVIVRRLTPLECERLQGFPDGWTDIPGTSDSQRYRQMGNSVAVPVFAWVLQRLAAVAADLAESAA